MGNLVGRAIGRQAVRGAQQRGWLDLKLGIALMRDRRVPFALKVISMFLGFGMLVLLEILELPLQTILMAMLPVLGLAIDFAIDGIEILALPLIFGSIVLTHLAPKSVVEQVLLERRG